MNLESPLEGTFRFYLSQLPMILNLILPYTLLLGTLWALTKLSSSSEITGMLQSGRSLLRINSPVIIGRRLCRRLLRYLRVPLGAELHAVPETHVLLPEPEQK